MKYDLSIDKTQHSVLPTV